MTKRVLITGIDSFTGKYLSNYLTQFGYDIYGTSLVHNAEKKYKCDITDKDNILDILREVNPDFIVHLSGISFVGYGSAEDFYKVNTIGSLNILEAVVALKLNPSKIIMVSSATIYGDQGLEVLDESLCPIPANHYGASKYAMENMVKNYFNQLNIIIARPFNYTGEGQAKQFLIPKIVEHFKEHKKEIELGNLYVSREFNDVTFVCEVYRKLMESNSKSTVVNIASNRGIELLDVIKMMNEIAGYKIDVKVNQAFIRKDEIKNLTGSSEKLFAMIGNIKQCTFHETLKKMYEA